ncbi:hypothetical protein M011DRAFT_481688 [Sporormia fimetaria CBS 119925]|uniref:Survival Motor Neuron Gemin2-binding domain-containing protein n=1 Tax=Sporormia fimetaria CBS 119925 TaxID=1340428 RepID=A0A6A6UYA8_9PLEO|nr:hypothetical protein M011DRAFT_481688 [Sporormia fimetaria CBS 119925]
MSKLELHNDNAWDDSALIDSWDEAVAEYKKYHSIQSQGKRLEDVLSKEELRQLREEHVDLVEEAQTHLEADGNKPADQANADVDETNHEPDSSEQAQQPSAAELHPVPQAILGTVQDENLRNLMMSWYYAGYYTGLYIRQQKKNT